MSTEFLTFREPAAVPAGTAADARIGLSPWGAFWRSRLLVWAAGMIGVVVLHVHFKGWSTDPQHVSASFGGLGNLLASPAVRWDSVWYLQIAHVGYRSAHDPAFFPVYPLLMRMIGSVVGSNALAGVLVSLGGLFAGLELVRRLTVLELGEGPAAVAVTFLAFTPMAVFFSAVYTESLFLALSAGSIYAARRGRWAAAGALGALASATRLTGVLLVVPVLLMYWYGPRGDLAPATRGGGWRPRYPTSARVLWAALIPGGAVAFSVYLGVRGFGPLASVTAEHMYWGRDTVNPIVGVLDGITAAFSQLHFVAHGALADKYQGQSLAQLAIFGLVIWALIGTFRRLPVAYGAYCALTTLLAVSSTAVGTGLVSFDRYASIEFPLYMTAAAWAVDRGLTRKVVLLCSLALIAFTVQFAAWQFVA